MPKQTDLIDLVSETVINSGIGGEINGGIGKASVAARAGWSNRGPLGTIEDAGMPGGNQTASAKWPPPDEGRAPIVHRLMATTRDGDADTDALPSVTTKMTGLENNRPCEEIAVTDPRNAGCDTVSGTATGQSARRNESEWIAGNRVTARATAKGLPNAKHAENVVAVT